MSAIREEDLKVFAHLIPSSGALLLSLLGNREALLLLNAWPGVQFNVPMGPDNNVYGARLWSKIVNIMGETATAKLAHDMGGECLEIPTLHRLRTERRNHVLRAEFDRLTDRPPAGEGMSKAQAVTELAILYAPITWRQIETILDRGF